MNKYCVTIFILIVFAISISTTLGAVGAYPIWEPTTITEPGLYVLTRDISVDEGPIITIDASNIVINLNNHVLTITNHVGSNIVILDGNSNITICNGTVVGGHTGIFHNSTATNTTLTFKSLILRDQHQVGIDLKGIKHIDIANCKVFMIGGDPNGILIEAETGVITDCTLFAGRLYLTNFVGGRIENNVFKDFNGPQGLGVLVFCNGGGNIIRNNTFYQGAGPAIQLKNAEGPDPCAAPNESNNNRVVGNLIDSVFESGIVAGSYNYITNNSIYNSGDADAQYGIQVGSHNTVRNNHLFTGNCIAGIEVVGEYNILDNNIIEEYYGQYAAGIRFTSTSTENVYRDNIVRDTYIPIDDSGTTNIDAGGNVY